MINLRVKTDKKRMNINIFMFKYNSLLAIEILYKYVPKTYIHKFIFKNDIWLKPTNEKI